jgi:hypothetical protein
MARRISFGESVMATIQSKLRIIGYNTCKNTMINIADTLMEQIDANKKFRNITGNAYTSFTIGVFYYGKLVYVSCKGDEAKEPTMRTLRKGQVYPLLYYYDGSHADPPYKGTVGHGGQWGPTLGPYRIKREKPKTRAAWSLMAIIPVEYASYNPNIVDTLTALKDLIPTIASAFASKSARQAINELTK